MSVVTIMGYGYFSWIPAMFMRTWDWSIAEIAYAYGIIILIAGPFGVNYAGWLADRWFNKGHKAAHMRVTLIGCVIMVPTSILVPLMPTPELALIMFVINVLGLTLGPLLIALVTDQYFADESMLRYSIAIVATLVGPGALWCLYISIRYFRASVIEAENWSSTT
jgi:hypothetical protein